MNPNNRIVVEVPRLGEIGGKLIRKYIKQDPILPKRALRYEGFIKLIEFCCVALIIGLDLFFSRVTHPCTNAMRLGSSITIYVLYLIRSVVRGYALFLGKDGTIRHLQPFFDKEQCVRVLFGLCLIVFGTWMCFYGDYIQQRNSYYLGVSIIALAGASAVTGFYMLKFQFISNSSSNEVATATEDLPMTSVSHHETNRPQTTNDDNSTILIHRPHDHASSTSSLNDRLDLLLPLAIHESNDSFNVNPD